MPSLQRLISWGHMLPAFSFNNPATPAPDLEMQAAPSEAHSDVIEQYENGYPRFAALLASSDNFLIFRRFKRLRARTLLFRQDKLTTLEARLDCIDRNEKWPTWLGTCRHDGNIERQKIMEEIETQFVEYDKCVKAAHEASKYDDAQSRDVDSLHNWLDGHGWIARDERSYLEHRHDLFSVAPNLDDAMNTFESWVEDRLIQMPWYRERYGNDASHDRRVHIYSGMTIRRLSLAILICLITIMLLLPIVICNVLTSPAVRLVIVMVSTVCYLLVLSTLTRARTTELVLAATTYATVLIVFVSGADGNPGPS